MKIICAGLWKTGTKSLAQCLKSFGYSVYDYEEQYIYLRPLWEKFLNGTVTDEEIYEAFKDIDVLIDGPTIVFWEEIFKVFPDAKVILTHRDTEDQWWNTWKNMVADFRKTRFLYYAMILTPSGRYMSSIGSRVFRLAWGVDADIGFSKDQNERLYKLKYRKHNAHVIHSVPDDQLLVHSSSDGWPKLCKFLDREIPDEPYPHKNKRSSIFKDEANHGILFAKLTRELKIYGFVYSVAIASAIYFGYSYFC